MKKISFMLLSCAFLVNSALAGRQFTTSYYQTSSMPSTPAVALEVYKEPSVKSPVVGKINTPDNFNVTRSEWVEVTSADGKVKGWSRDKDVQKHIDSVYGQSYVVHFDGSDNKYTVKKISPAQQKEQYDKAAKNARKMWKRQRRLLEEALLGPMFDDDDSEDDAAQNNAKLQAEINVLTKKVTDLEKKR